MVPPDNLAHLPRRKRWEIERAAQVLFIEFEEAQTTKLSEKSRRGRILKLILFGSYASDAWMGSHQRGYFPGYDLLVVVNYEGFSGGYEAWERARQRLLHEHMMTYRISTPVNFVVHTYQDMNDQLARGHCFFMDIARSGIVLYDTPGYPLAKPKAVDPLVARVEARHCYDHWFASAGRFLRLAFVALADDFDNEAAFLLHQATERFYLCVLRALALYSPRSHQLDFLRSQAERIAPELIKVWPRDTSFARRCFRRLDHAYVEARYSPDYAIVPEELTWIAEHVTHLRQAIEAVCTEYLGSASETKADGEKS